MVEKITAYRTSDGTIFDCDLKAIKWEKSLQANIDIKNLISKAHLLCEYEEVVEDFIEDFGDKLYEILHRKYG